MHDIRVLVDTSVLEIYLNGGETVLSTRYFAETDELTITADLPGAQGTWYPMDPISINYVVDR